jgi:hypothetical protein
MQKEGNDNYTVRQPRSWVEYPRANKRAIMDILGRLRTKNAPLLFIIE